MMLYSSNLIEPNERVPIGRKLYLIQAKRYFDHVNPQHIRKLYQVIQEAKAAGGFFVHTGEIGSYIPHLSLWVSTK